MNGSWMHIKGALAVAALIGGTSPTVAAPISGTLNLAGSVTTLDAVDGAPVGTATATYMDFTPPSGGGIGSVTRTDASGSFSSVPPLSTGTIKDFSTVGFAPIICFIAIGDFCIDLNSITVVEKNSVEQVVEGGGIAREIQGGGGGGSGDGPTPVIVNITVPSGGTFTASISAVPAPGMFALVGASLVALGLLQRRKRRLA